MLSWDTPEKNSRTHTLLLPGNLKKTNETTKQRYMKILTWLWIFACVYLAINPFSYLHSVIYIQQNMAVLLQLRVLKTLPFVADKRKQSKRWIKTKTILFTTTPPLSSASPDTEGSCGISCNIWPFYVRAHPLVKFNKPVVKHYGEVSHFYTTLNRAQFPKDFTS